MPRFFFDFSDGPMTIDDEGTEFANAHAARDAAVRTLPEIAIDKTDLQQNRMVSVLMRDDVGRYLFTASLNLSGRWLVETA